MPKPNKPMNLELIGLDKIPQIDQLPARSQKVIGECLARMLMRRKERKENAKQEGRLPITGDDAGARAEG